MKRRYLIFTSLLLLAFTGVAAAATWDFVQSESVPGHSMAGGEHIPNESIYVIVDRGNHINFNYDHIEVYSEGWTQLDRFDYQHGGNGNIGGVEYHNGFIWVQVQGDSTGGTDYIGKFEWDSATNSLTQVDEFDIAGGDHDSAINGLERYGNFWYMFSNNDQTIYRYSSDWSSRNTFHPAVSGTLGGGMAVTDGTFYLLDDTNTINVYNNSSFIRSHTVSLTDTDSADGLFQEFNNGNYVTYDNTNGEFDYYEGNLPAAFQKQFFVDGYVIDRNLQGINNATISQNVTAQTTLTDQSGYFNMTLSNGTYKFTADKTDFQPHNITREINGSKITLEFRLLQGTTRFNLIANNYMEHGSTQSYKVNYVDITDNGKLISKRVTNQANVTSADTNIVSVNTNNTELVATSNRSINAQVQITAEYTNSNNETFTDIETITVANLTVENIDIMPGTQYFNAFLGTGEESTVFGMGSEIQWIFLIIILGGTVGFVSGNEWAGIGSMVIAEIIFWIMGNIDVGTMIVGVMFAIAMSLTLIDIPSRHETNLTVEQSNPQEFQKFE